MECEKIFLEEDEEEEVDDNGKREQVNSVRVRILPARMKEPTKNGRRNVDKNEVTAAPLSNNCMEEIDPNPNKGIKNNGMYCNDVLEYVVVLVYAGICLLLEVRILVCIFFFKGDVYVMCLLVIDVRTGTTDGRYRGTYYIDLSTIYVPVQLYSIAQYVR
jgi:hypothetical protein